MSFQSYIDNKKAITGTTPEDFKKQLEKEGLRNAKLKATELVK